MRKVMVIVVLAGLLGAAVPVVLAAPATQEAVVPPLVDALRMVAEASVTGVVIAFLFERFAWFQALSSDQRWWVILGISLGLPVLAQVLLEFVPAEVWLALEPYWYALAAGFVGWASSQAVYRGLIEPKRREEEAYRLLRERHTG